MSLTVINYAVATNEDWRDTLTLTSGEDTGGDPVPVNLTGSTFIAHLRQPIDALSVALECSTGNGRLVIVDPPTVGILAWNVPVEILELMTIGDYSYDILWQSIDGATDRIVSGKITLERGVTRP